MLKKSFRLLVLMPLALVATSVLVGCGGSGAGSGNTVSPIKAVSDPVSVTAKAMTLLTSVPSLPSDGRTTTTITVAVKDASNRTLKGATVDLSTVDSGSTLTVLNSVTGEAGTITATLSSSSKANRSIEVVAKVGALVNKILIPVAGTTLTISGPQSLAANAKGNFSLSVRDSAGVGIAGQTVTLKSSLGTAFAPATITTDNNGQASVSLTPSKSGVDSIVAEATGATTTFNVNIAAASLSISGVVANDEVVVGTQRQVTVALVDQGVPVSGRAISISATRGVISPSALLVTTDASGSASFNVSSLASGLSTISVDDAISKTSATVQIEFVSRTPAVTVLQIVKPVLAINQPGSSTNSTQLIASVKDAAGNPVKNIRVNFTAVSDPSGGRIDPAFSFTDSGGLASVAFISGPSPSGPDKVQLRASVPGTVAATATTNMTVTNSQASIRIGTGSDISAEDTRYFDPWNALVVDSSGAPITDAEVSLQITTVEYYKGIWVKDGFWRPYGITALPPVTDPPTPVTYSPPIACPSEDTNRNGVMDSGEDINGNGVLDGFNIATAAFKAGSKTGADGFVAFNVIYAKSYGNWAKVRVDAKVTVAGTESVTSETFVLPISSTDAKADFPPGASGIGPFGRFQSCTDRN